MTRRISAVAVCCSSASFVSLNSRTFSIAITAWAANVFASSICLVGEELDFSPPQDNDPDRVHLRVAAGWPAVSESGPEQPRACLRLGEFRVSCLNVLDVDRLAIKDHAPGHGSGGNRDGPADRDCRRLRPMHRDEPERLAFQAPDRGIGRAAESRGALGHDVHHGLKIGRRAGDHPQDLRRRGLLLQRLGQRLPEAFELALRIRV